MIQLYTDGASDREICKSLKITYSDFDKRYKSDETFQKLVDFGRLAAHAWWLELGRKGASGAIKGFNFQPWYANMKNRFGWSDKVENVNSDDKPVEQLSQDELISRITNYKSKVAKLLKSSNVFEPSDPVSSGTVTN